MPEVIGVHGEYVHRCKCSSRILNIFLLQISHYLPSRVSLVLRSVLGTATLFAFRRRRRGRRFSSVKETDMTPVDTKNTAQVIPKFIVRGGTPGIIHIVGALQHEPVIGRTCFVAAERNVLVQTALAPDLRYNSGMTDVYFQEPRPNLTLPPPQQS